MQIFGIILNLDEIIMTAIMDITITIPASEPNSGIACVSDISIMSVSAD